MKILNRIYRIKLSNNTKSHCSSNRLLNWWDSTKTLELMIIECLGCRDCHRWQAVWSMSLTMALLVHQLWCSTMEWAWIRYRRIIIKQMLNQFSHMGEAATIQSNLPMNSKCQMQGRQGRCNNSITRLNHLEILTQLQEKVVKEIWMATQRINLIQLL